LENLKIDARWFKSYLQNRNHRVVTGKETSDIKFSRIGLPQGTILGPILFSIFINDLPEVLNQLTCYLFADDNNTAAASTIENKQNLIDGIQEDLTAITKWMEKTK